MGKLMVAAGLAAVAGCAMFAPKTFDGVDMAPGDLEADDLTPLECVRDVPGDPIVVVDRDNVARLPIVYQNKGKCGETAKYLQKAIFEMTGVKPQIVVERDKDKPVTNSPAFFIGATAAATYGASLLCYVTPAEHLGLPDGEEVHQGCIAYRIAAHAGDVARGLPGARDRDDAMAHARAEFDWDRQFVLCMDPARAKARWLKTRAFTDEAHGDDHCSMCGKQFCAVRTSRRIKKLAAEL